MHRTVQRHIRQYSSWIITLVLLGVFAWYAATNQDIFAALGAVAVGWLVLIAAFRVLMILSNGLFTKITVEAFTGKITTRESFYVSILTAVGNFFGPLFGGLSIRAVYLKKIHHLPYSKFTATLVGYYLLMFIGNSLLALVGLLLLEDTHQTLYLTGIFGAWLLLFIGFAFVRLPQKNKLDFMQRNRVLRFMHKVLYDIDAGWRVLLADKRLMAQAALLAVFNLAMVVLITLVEFWALNISITLPALLLYSALVQVSILLSITPGAVGVREALLLVVATTLGVTGQEILQVAIIDRGVQFIIIALLALSTRHSKLRAKLTDKNSV